MTTTESPCNGVCRMNQATALCEGCVRTIDEIMGWGGMTPAERRAVMATLPGRRLPE